MLYKYNGITHNIPDNEVDNYVETLGISIAEACELYLTDKEVITNDIVEELEVKAKKNNVTQTIHNAKGDKKPRKVKEKKENPLKKEIIDTIFYYLSNPHNLNFTIDKIFVRNDEKYIDFVSNNRSFTLDLVEHRLKKAKN